MSKGLVSRGLRSWSKEEEEEEETNRDITAWQNEQNRAIGTTMVDTYLLGTVWIKYCDAEIKGEPR